MANRLRLIHLTVLGENLQPAMVEFGDRLTVIHGASDTGKSHIFDLIRYVCGLSRSIDVPEEGKKYQYVHLGVSTGDDHIITLTRALSGGKIGVFEGDWRQLPAGPPSELLDPRHVSKDPHSISRRLLSLIGLDEWFVRKNQNNETRMLEWRDVARLATVDEESIIAKRSPIEFGQYQHRPVEAAIFRLFIEGSDDAELVPIPKAADLKKISMNKIEILDQLISRLEQELADSPPAEELRKQLARLKDSLAKETKSLANLSATRDQLVVKSSENTNARANLRERLNEVLNLQLRFDLLLNQYESDLSRLEMLDQVTDVLSESTDRDCPFCGAAPNHQHWPESLYEETDTATFASSIRSEKSKIDVLRADLRQTISALQREEDEINNTLNALLKENQELTFEIHKLDKDMQKPGNNLDKLLNNRSRLERQLDSQARLASLLSLRTSTAQVERPKTTAQVPIAAADLREFDKVAEEVLEQWSFPRGSTVNYSIEEKDLIIENRPRQTHGKGVRSILHALFNVALAEYCLRRGYPHPGFVILDSPIVSYRQPEEPEPVGEDETISTKVVDAFYSYLQNHFMGQAIVLENKSPISPLPAGSREYFFEGTSKSSKRAGFYPSEG